MSTSGIEPRMRRRILTCLLASALMLIVSEVYQYFGHEVTSQVMSLTPFVPLIGGMMQLLIWEWLKHPKELSGHVIWMQNILFAGLSAVVAGMFLQGIVDIAGVDSGYPIYFIGVGGLMVLYGSIGIWVLRE